MNKKPTHFIEQWNVRREIEKTYGNRECFYLEEIDLLEEILERTKKYYDTIHTRLENLPKGFNYTQ